MAVAYVNHASASSAGAATTIAPAYPASIVAGNLLTLGVAVKYPNTVDTPAGWTAVTGSPVSHGTVTGANDTGSMWVYHFYKVATGSETGTLTVTMQGATTGSSSQASMQQWSKTGGTWQVVCDGGVDNTSGTAWSVTGSATNYTAGEQVWITTAIPTDLPTAMASDAISGTGLTFAAVTSRNGWFGTTGGTDNGYRTTSTSVTAGSGGPVTYTATFTSTNGTNIVGVSTFLRLSEGVASTPLSAALTESDILAATLTTSVAVAPAFAESDVLAMTLVSPMALTAALAEADTLAATLVSPTALAAGFTESDTVTATLVTSVAVAPAFAESDTLTATLATSPSAPVLTVDTTDTITPAFTETDTLSAVLVSPTVLAAAFTESDVLTAALVSPTALAAGFTETDLLAASLVTSPAAPVLTVDTTETITASLVESSTLSAILVTSMALTVALAESDLLAVALTGSPLDIVQTSRGTATLTAVHGTATLAAAKAGTAVLTGAHGTATLTPARYGTATLQE